MDFVYICRSGENEELRYSIRSVINSFPDAKVWVVGGKPDWYIGSYIQVKQDQNRYSNVQNNLKAICESEYIADDFIFMNDDFFIINNISSIEVFNGGLLLNKLNEYIDLDARSMYSNMLNVTYDRLIKIGFDNPVDYELHVPFLVNKEKLKTIVNKHPRFLWRSMYGNIFNIGGKTIKDVKVYNNKKFIKRSHDLNLKSDFLSTHDESFELIINELIEKFPNKTTYEF